MKRILSILICGAMLSGIVPAMAAESPIINNNFEEGDIGFSQRGTVTIEKSAVTANSGSSSMLLKDRGSESWEGASASIVNDVKLDETYNAQMYVKAADEDAHFTVKMSLELEDADGMQYPLVAQATVNGSDWTLIEGSWTADYQGNLKVLNFNIETDSDGNGKSFYVDDVFFAHQSVGKPKNEADILADTASELTYSGIKLPTDAEGAEWSEDVEKLMALGVTDGYPDGEFKPDNNVTRAEYLTMLARLLRMEPIQSTGNRYIDVPEDHWANSAVEMMAVLGVCDGYGDGRFGPEDNVTYAQAVKMLLGVLGFSAVAELKGGYPDGYMSAALSAKIQASGAVRDEPLTRAMTAELLCSALDVDMYLRDSLGNYTLSDGETIITSYFEGDVLKGYVASSESISTDGSKAGVNAVIIEGEEYRTGITRAEELVGYNVDFIYETVDGEKTLLYICPRTSKTEEFTMDARDIEGFSNYTYKYFTSETRSETKTKKLSKDFTLVYNGKTMEDAYSDELMVPEVGSVRLVGSDRSSYDTVYITAYDIHVVSSVNTGMGYIYDVDNNQLDFSVEEDTVFINPNGSEGSISDVKKDDILHIMSTPGESEKTVQIIRSTISGSVKYVNDEDIGIDEEQYDLSNTFLSRSYRLPKPGTEVTAYLDINGDIVYIEDDADESMEVGYLIGAYVKDSRDALSVKYMNTSGALTTAEIDDRVKIDGIMYKNDDMEKVLSVLKGFTGDNSTKQRIFRYKKKSGGMINQIDFPRDQEALSSSDEVNEGKDTLHVIKGDGITKYKYKSSVQTFHNTSNGSFAVKADVPIFNIPAPGSIYEGNYSEYGIKKSSSLWNDTDYKVIAYSVDCDTVFADYLVMYSDGPSSGSINGRNAYVVTKVMESINADNEDVHCIEVYDNGKKKYVLKNEDAWKAALETNEGSEIKKGDIVRFDTDSSGQISNLTIADNKGSYDDYFFAATGYLFMKDDGYAYFTKNMPDQSTSISDDGMILIPLDKFKITIYDRSDDEVYEGVADEIVDYKTDPGNISKIYITMNYENPESLICVID